MALTKMVDGVAITCSNEEETALHAEWAAWVPPVPIDRSDVNMLQKEIKALALCVAQIGGLTVPQMRALFKSKWDLLP